MKIIFKKNNEITKECEYKNEISILQVAQNNHVKITHSCDGHGVCGQCHVKIIKQENLNQKNEIEDDTLDIVRNCDEYSRLACQAHIVKSDNDVVVELLD